MTRLIKRKLLVILKVRKLFIYRVILHLIFIDDVVLESFIIRGKMTAIVLPISYDIPNGIMSGVPNGVLNGAPNGSQMTY